MFNLARNAIHRSGSELENLINRQRTAAEGAKQIKRGWGGVKSAIGGAITAYGAVQVAQAVDTYTNANARLALINDGLQTQAELQEKVYQAAQRSSGSYNDMVSVVAKLGLLAEDAFRSNDELVTFSELMQKSFAVSGASTMEQQAGMYQLTQAMAAGKLQGDEFRSIMENAPMLAQAIADFTGKSKGELKQMSADGTITADTIKGALFTAAADIEAKFAKMPRTFSSTWTQITNYALMAFGGVMQTINNFLNSSTGSAFVDGILGAINLIASAITWLIGIISTVGTFIQNNWSVLQPTLTQIAIAVGIALVTAFLMWAYSAITAGIASIMALSPIILIAFAIGMAIGLVIAILNNMGVTFDQVAGFIGGTLSGLYAFFFNIVASIWNYWSSFVEFFANAFNHPVYSVKRLFINLANSVLDTVKSIAEAMDAVFGSNLAGGVTGLQSQMEDWLGEMPKGYKVMQRLEMKSIPDYAKKGYSAGVDMVNGISNKFSGVPSLLKKGGIGSSFDSKMKLPDISKVGEVGKVKDDVNIAEEDLQLMKDVAEMRYVQNFVTLTPTISMQASISERVDVDHVLDAVERRMVDEIAANAEGIYE
ncbi:phage-related minor tail protein [Paenibacillus popilliae ATCC 14706]|uniref:Phage-related minor tail protein n=2 Tax=Paenibacillus popilliae TaxID=78057 RepID=M9L971_PAEPP|nr:phage-related minor tail protein [Paenibacillus popilliae ATCC 14706]